MPPPERVAKAVPSEGPGRRPGRIGGHAVGPTPWKHRHGVGPSRDGARGVRLRHQRLSQYATALMRPAWVCGFVPKTRQPSRVPSTLRAAPGVMRGAWELSKPQEIAS